MKAYQQWDEINKFFALNSKRNKETNMILKDLYFTDTTLEKYLTNNYALWLDLRSTDDNSLHGSGRRIENASEGITIQITKEAGADEPINVICLLYKMHKLILKMVDLKKSIINQ